MAEAEDQAVFKLGLPKLPSDTDDQMVAWVAWRDVKIRVVWRASKHADLLNLLDSLVEQDFWINAKEEFDIAVSMGEVDQDLDDLLGETDE